MQLLNEMKMAPQVGLEPTTYGLTVRRSNQLSYWGILKAYYFRVLVWLPKLDSNQRPTD
jgi:hypothetical protein